MRGLQGQLKGFQVGKKRLLEGFGPRGSSSVSFEPKHLEPAALAERFLQPEQPELARPVRGGEQAGVGVTASSLAAYRESETS